MEQQRQAKDMEPLDREVAEAVIEASPLAGNSPAGVLIVGCDDLTRRTILTALKRRRHNVRCTNALDDSFSALAGESFDLIVSQLHLPDGDAIKLAQHVSRACPATKLVLLSDQAALSSVIEAMRLGVVDFLPLPMAGEDLVHRVEVALQKSRQDRQRDEKLTRLKTICQKLNVARHEIGEQVDSLCHDLVAAYEDMAEQINEASMASEFRTLLKQELDVEDLLRTALEYMLTKTGPTNAAVFLPDTMSRFSLGAYVNYDCPRETISIMLDHLGQAICPQMADEKEIVSFEDAQEFADFIGTETAGFLDESQVVAFSCRHEGKCMGVIVLFRDKAEPFSEDLGTVIEVLRPIFAQQVNNVIKVHHRAQPSWPKQAIEDDADLNDDSDYGFGLAA